MNGIDFKKAADLFMASEHELALALGITDDQLRGFRKTSDRVPPQVMHRLATTLVERGRAMIRVGEMLHHD